MRKYIYIFIFLIILFSAQNALAADIFLISEKSMVIENQVFTVNVFVDTQGTNINNIEGNISFPTNLISVESIGNTGSIFSIWVEPPTFSNTLGNISFNGGVPTPGYAGARGKIISILFKAKKAGNAQLSFTSGNVYANDGLGTNVTDSRIGTNIVIAPYQGPQNETEIITSDKLPVSPIIYSKEMPDPEEWYSLNKVTFYWDLPKGVNTTQLLLGSYPESTPTVAYAPPIKEKELNDLGDGIRYIHVRFKNDAGWGKTAHRKIKVDNTAPKNVEVFSSADKNDLITLKISAEDATSGIGKFKISIDGIFILDAVAKGNSVEVLLPAQKAGNHEVNIIAYDRAGNISEKIQTIEFPAMSSPEVLEYTELIKKGEKFEIKGLSYPNTDVKIYIQNEKSIPKSYITKTLEDGSFSFISEEINKVGLTSFWAEAIRGEISSPSSDKYFVQVNRSAFVKLSIQTIEILSVSIPLLLLLIILIYIAYHAYHKLRKMRRRLLRDLEETESEAHKIFRIIKEDAKQSLRILKKKEIKEKLTEDEDEGLETLSKDIEEAEEYFAKRIKSIERKDL
jgi:hypothetical protein